MPKGPDFKYRAFLSYSHRDRDKGEKLHTALERFEIPRDLAGKPGTHGAVPSKLRPIFRDRYDMEAGHSLKEQIEEALRQSEALIVLCSPAAAKSPYVASEISNFKKLGRSSRIYPIIVDGEPGDPERECFPKVLKQKAAPDGTLTEELEEPLASDARPEGDGWELARQKLIAGLIGVDLDTLRQREAEALRRQRRFWIGVSAVMALLAVGATVSAVYAWWLSDKNEKITVAVLERAKSLVESSVKTTEEFGVPAKVGLNILNEAGGIFGDMDRIGGGGDRLQMGRAEMLMTFADSLQRIGKVAEQKERAQEAVKIADDLLAASPDDPERLHLKAKTLVRLGRAHVTQGEMATGLAVYGQALELREKRLDGMNATDVHHLTALTILHYNISQAHSRRNERTAALAAAQLSAQAAERMRAVGAPESDVADRLVQALIVISDMHRQLGEHAKSIDVADEGLKVVATLLAGASDRVRWRRFKADLIVIKGDVTRARDSQTRQALAFYEESLAIRAELEKADPQNAAIASEAAFSRIKIGEELRKFGELDRAEESFRAAGDAYRAILDRNPSHRSAARQFINVLEGIGEIKRRKGEQAERLKFYEEQREITLKLLEADKDNRDFKRLLGQTETLLGNAHLEQGRPEVAIPHYERSVAVLKGLSDPIAEEEYALATALQQFSVARRDRKEYEEAIRLIDESIALRRLRMQRPDPVANDKLRLAAALQEKVETLLEKGAPGDALPLAEEAIQLRRPLYDPEKSDATTARQLALAIEQAGRAKLALGDAMAALALLEEGRPIRTSLFEKGKDAQSQRNLAETWRLVAEAKRAQGNCSAADAYETARGLMAQASTRVPENAAWQEQLAVIEAELAAPLAGCAADPAAPAAPETSAPVPAPSAP